MTTGIEAAPDPPEWLADGPDTLHGKMLDIGMLMLTQYGQECTEEPERNLNLLHVVDFGFVVPPPSPSWRSRSEKRLGSW
jgi:hypothetical protein